MSPTAQGVQAPAAASALPNAPATEVPVRRASQPGDPQTFTAGGVTRQLPSYQPQAEQTPFQRTLSQPTVAPRAPAPQNHGVAPQGGVIRNPDEDRRRLQIALSTTGRGSPSVRRALMDQYGDQQQRQHDGHQAALNRTDAAARTMMEAYAAANEAYADRRQAADQFNVTTAAQQQARADGQRAMVRTLTDQQGNTNVLRQDGSLTPITDAVGTPVRELVERRGAITPELQFKSLVDQMTTLMSGMGYGTPDRDGNPDPRVAQVEGYQRQIAELLGQQRQPPPAAIEELRANPGAAAQFDEVFGAGAAARYLER